MLNELMIGQNSHHFITVIFFSQSILVDSFCRTPHKGKNKENEKTGTSSCATNYNTKQTGHEELIEMFSHSFREKTN